LGDSAGQSRTNALGDQSSVAVDSRFHEAGHDVLGDPVPEPAPEPIVVPYTPSDESADSSADDGDSSSYDDSRTRRTTAAINSGQRMRGHGTT